MLICFCDKKGNLIKNSEQCSESKIISHPYEVIYYLLNLIINKRAKTLFLVFNKSIWSILTSKNRSSKPTHRPFISIVSFGRTPFILILLSTKQAIPGAK